MIHVSPSLSRRADSQLWSSIYGLEDDDVDMRTCKQTVSPLCDARVDSTRGVVMVWLNL